ncbi:MAG: superoxide dismutase family protein [Acidobacteria bacterium]|nr:superoxide dismutase family protein [Acidobacteriota bacterium]
MKTAQFFLVGAVAMGMAMLHGLAATRPARKSIELKNAKGESVGMARLKPKGKGVAISVNFRNLPPGEHALHIHEYAKCEADAAVPADAFKSAGPHFNPEGKKHGLQNPAGPHAGDLPNFIVSAKGTAKTTIEAPHVSLAEDAAASVYANGGTALVIHAKADDLKTDPAGNAGPRIACGVITK